MLFTKGLKKWKESLKIMPVVSIWSSFQLSKAVVDSRIRMDKLRPRDDQIYEAKDAAMVEEEESKFTEFCRKTLINVL